MVVNMVSTWVFKMPKNYYTGTAHMCSLPYYYYLFTIEAIQYTIGS